MKLNKGLKIAGIVIVATSFVLILIISSFAYWLTSGPIEFEPIKFESSVWKQTKPEMSWESVHLKMADDLVEKHIKVGLTKEQIIILIGQPSTTNYFKNYDMVYYLGRERSPIGIDSEWLVIKLKNTKVEHYRLISD